MKGKKGALPALGVMVMVMLAGIGVFAGGMYLIDKVRDTGTTTLAIGDKTVITDADTAIAAKTLTSCDGIKSVYALYDDLNAYKIGTDPNSNMTIFEHNGKNYKLSVVDDAASTSVPYLSEFTALAGNTLGVPKSAYFSEVVGFETACADVPLQVELYPASKPTLTIVNDDGKTINSDSNHEDMAASSTYNPCVTVKAPAEACASRYGAAFVVEYDATYINKVDGTGYFDSTSQGFLATHSGNLSASMAYDQYKVMLWDDAVQDIDGDGQLDAGALCNGKKVDVCFTLESTSQSPAEDTNNVVIHWVPLNYDLDSDKMELIKGIYDEDNNLISQGNTTATFYTA